MLWYFSYYLYLDAFKFIFFSETCNIILTYKMFWFFLHKTCYGYFFFYFIIWAEEFALCAKLFQNLNAIQATDIKNLVKKTDCAKKNFWNSKETTWSWSRLKYYYTSVVFENFTKDNLASRLAQAKSSDEWIRLIQFFSSLTLNHKIFTIRLF